jgi:uncharacterized protein (DUF1800 family)
MAHNIVSHFYLYASLNIFAKAKSNVYTLIFFMPTSNRLKNQHLLWRAAFGPMAENVLDLDNITQKKLWATLLTTSEDVPTKMSIAKDPRKDDAYKNEDGTTMQYGKMDAITRKLLAQQYREDLKDMNIAWLNNMINSKAQLREKMSFFWHGHFACRSRNALASQELLNIVKENALGNFGDLLRAVSKSPAMITFLNNQQNKKDHPNENFAREVMELFTLGRGNYTETDVKEAARAFTGWNLGQNGEFMFRPRLHDAGTKTILGQTGNFKGDDVIDILLKMPQTANFICKKAYKFFVNENVDETKVQFLASRFFKNNYDIKKLLEDIFTSDWFYEQKNIGAKIKSPIELLAGIRRYIPMVMDNDEVQILFQKVLGQILFYPPNVAGWAGGKNWIDSSTLMVRLQLPQVLSAKDYLDIKPKGDDDTDMGMAVENRKRLGKNALLIKREVAAQLNWVLVNKNFETTNRTALAQTIIDTLLQSKGNVNEKILASYLNNENRENFIKSVVISVMSTPEYQLC